MKQAMFVLLLTVCVLKKKKKKSVSLICRLTERVTVNLQHYSHIHILAFSPLEAAGSVNPFRGSLQYQRLYKKTLIRFGALESHHPISPILFQK